MSRRKKLKCALITKCSGAQGVVSASVELTSLTLDKQMQHKKSTTVDDHNMATGNLATWQLGKGQHNSKTLAACDDKIVRGSSSNSRKKGGRQRLRRTGTVPGNGSTFCTHN